MKQLNNIKYYKDYFLDENSLIRPGHLIPKGIGLNDTLENSKRYMPAKSIDDLAKLAQLERQHINLAKPVLPKKYVTKFPSLTRAAYDGNLDPRDQAATISQVSANNYINGTAKLFLKYQKELPHPANSESIKKRAEMLVKDQVRPVNYGQTSKNSKYKENRQADTTSQPSVKDLKYSYNLSNPHLVQTQRLLNDLALKHNKNKTDLKSVINMYQEKLIGKAEVLKDCLAEMTLKDLSFLESKLKNEHSQQLDKLKLRLSSIQKNLNDLIVKNLDVISAVRLSSSVKAHVYHISVEATKNQDQDLMNLSDKYHKLVDRVIIHTKEKKALKILKSIDESTYQPQNLNKLITNLKLFLASADDNKTSNIIKKINKSTSKLAVKKLLGDLVLDRSSPIAHNFYKLEDPGFVRDFLKGFNLINAKDPFMEDFKKLVA
jgi:hypothetical protein